VINILKIFYLVFILVIPGPAPGEATPTTLLSGIGNYADGQHIAFPTSFATVPTVIVNAALAGKAMKAAAVNVTKTGFNLAIVDTSGQLVTSAAQVNWVAAVAQYGLQTGSLAIPADGLVNFTQPLAGEVHILTNAVKNGTPLLSARVNLDFSVNRTWFQVSVFDNAGHTVTGATVHWMAFKSSLLAICPTGQTDATGGIMFPTVSGPAAILISAYGVGPLAVASTGIANDRAHFTASLVDYLGRPCTIAQTTVKDILIFRNALVQAGGQASTTTTSIAPATTTTTTTGGTGGPDIQMMLGGYNGNNSTVTFKQAFRDIPTVIASGWHGADKPVLIAAQNVTKTGFKLRIYDFNNTPVTGNVMVQWVAALPQSGLELGHHDGLNADHIPLHKATAPAVVLMNAQKNGIPLAASAANPGASFFSVNVKDANGPVTQQISVDWIAVYPDPKWRAAGMVHVAAENALSFEAMTTYPIVMATAYGGNAPYVSATTNITVSGTRVLVAQRSGAAVDGASLLFAYWAVPTGITPTSTTTTSVAGGGGTGGGGTQPPVCNLTLSGAGRILTSSCPIFVPTERIGDFNWDIDADRLYQEFEDKAMLLLNPRFILDEEEDWLQHKSAHPVFNFVRVQPYPTRENCQYVLLSYAATWSRDYGRFVNNNAQIVVWATLPTAVPGAVKDAIAQKIRDLLKDYTREHNGDVEEVIMAWKVDNDHKTLRLKYVYTSAHGNEETGHSAVWNAFGVTYTSGQMKHAGVTLSFNTPSLSNPTGVSFSLGWKQNKADPMHSALEFTDEGLLTLYPSEDKHAIYPTAKCGDDVTLIQIDYCKDIGEDCGGASPAYRFDCVNVGEPAEGDRPAKYLVDDLDAPTSWLHLTTAQVNALAGKFPGEQVWSGNKALLLMTGNQTRKFLGGQGTLNWEDSPGCIGGVLSSPPAKLAAKLK